LFFFQAEDRIRDKLVTGVQTCALPIFHVNGERLLRLRSHKQEAILALLTLRHDRPVERAWLAGLLWPDSPTSIGLATLRRYLTRSEERRVGKECRRGRASAA